MSYLCLGHPDYRHYFFFWLRERELEREREFLEFIQEVNKLSLTPSIFWDPICRMNHVGKFQSKMNEDKYKGTIGNVRWISTKKTSLYFECQLNYITLEKSHILTNYTILCNTPKNDVVTFSPHKRLRANNT